MFQDAVFVDVHERLMIRIVGKQCRVYREMPDSRLERHTIGDFNRRPFGKRTNSL